MPAHILDAFYLGIRSDLDPAEGHGSANAEGAGAIVGQSFGSARDKLRDSMVSVAMNGAGGDGAPDGARQAESLTYNLGGGRVTRALDSAQTYVATVTYPAWTGLAPRSVEVVIAQDAAGNLFWLPPAASGAEATRAAMAAGPVQSLTILSVVRADGAGLTVPRQSADLLCFAEGTRLRTARGDVAVEDLRPGDLVTTLDHGLQPLRWITGRRVPAEGALAPVVIAPGALGNAHELRLSPRHRVLVRGWRAEMFFGESAVLAPAKALVDGEQIVRRTGGMVRYFHLLFDRHEIVFAEDIPCESLHLTEITLRGLSPEARAEIRRLFPELYASAQNPQPAAHAALPTRAAGLLH